MALFGQPKPIDPLFMLPKVSPRECTLMGLPNMNQMTMTNFAWLEKQLRKGQDQSYWVIKVFESEKFWTNISVDVDDLALQVVRMACSLQNVEPSNEDGATLIMHAKFGILAGMFERSSNASSVGDCHPLMWNALKFFTMAVPDDRKTHFYEANRVMFDMVNFAGYGFGKIPNLTIQKLFSRWHL